MGRSSRQRRQRRARLRVGGLRRWIVVGALCLVALLYYRPLRAYFDTRKQVAAREGEVRQLETQNRNFLQRVQLDESGATLLRDARRLSLVKPGERLFIVRGIAEWRRAHSRRAHRR